MSASITTYATSQAFLEAAQPLLLRDEPTNLLLLSLCATMKHFPQRRRNVPYLATLEADGALAAAAVIMPPRPLVIYGSTEMAHQRWADLAAHVRREGRVVWGVAGPAADADHFARYWSGQSGGPAELVKRQRIYVQSEQQSLPPVPGGLRLAEADDYPTIVQWIAESPETMELGGDPEVVRVVAGELIKNQDAYLWVNERPVALAARARRTENGLSLGQIYTAPDARRNGFATAAVTATANAVLAQGWRFCTIPADLDRPYAEAVCLSAGFRATTAFAEYRFG